MPNTKSAIRRVKRVKKQLVVNKFRKNRYKTALKKMNKLIEKKDLKEIKKFYPTFQSELMKVAKTGIIKKENISRKISRVARRVKKINK
tara:strand:+ start:529 stop:795 length:267 start_codon:yes stop_codon:yes gene_type:complete